MKAPIPAWCAYFGKHTIDIFATAQYKIQSCLIIKVKLFHRYDWVFPLKDQLHDKVKAQAVTVWVVVNFPEQKYSCRFAWILVVTALRLGNKGQAQGDDQEKRNQKV